MTKVIEEWLQEEVTSLSDMEVSLQKELKHLPKGRLEISLAKRQYPQYYCVTVEQGRKKRQYLSKKRGFCQKGAGAEGIYSKNLAHFAGTKGNIEKNAIYIGTIGC